MATHDPKKKEEKGGNQRREKTRANGGIHEFGGVTKSKYPADGGNSARLEKILLWRGIQGLGLALII